MTPSRQRWRWLIKQVQKSFFWQRLLKVFLPIPRGQNPQKYKGWCAEEKDDAESDIENIKSNGLPKNTGWPWLLIPPGASKMD